MGASLTVVALSDTHGYHREVAVPPGDLLVHAGDLTLTGQLHQVEDFDDWLAGLPHRHKVVIAGNHDFCFERPAERQRARALLRHAVYLEDSAVELCGLEIYGSPWQPWFLDWAFNLHRGAQIAARWALIPEHTDLLLTHGPPHGIGDLTFAGLHVGCEDLLDRVRAVRPRLHVFGHIHEAAGRWEQDGTIFVNASSTEAGAPATVIELERP
jgi:Icc-related predicted phosphoesterase